MEMYRAAEEESEEQIRQKKLEEALEIKSLRRIISAYLNYPDASEEDVRRYERSYKKLSPAHKVLIPHYPRKFSKLRQCIAANSYFIFSMLQAFDPPLDLSEDVDIAAHAPHDKPHDPLLSSNRDSLPSRTVATSQDRCLSEGSKAGCGKQSNAAQSSERIARTVAVESSCSHVSNQENPPLKSRDNEERCRHDDIACSNVHVTSSHSDGMDPSLQLDVPLFDVDKVRCIVRNIVRDWAAEGKKERDECYKPILEELDALFPKRTKKSPPACLVPGAGLGRLALEISSRGFLSQGNEFSYYMMICSSFILNQTQTVDEWTIYPWIHSNCNSISDDDQLRPVSFPDVLPASAGITEGFSMCGGDFVEVYNDSCHVGMWDVVVTCFFIDTAHNVIEYIEIISRILKDGGVWINLGPLLYHFADMYGQENEMSIELSLEDVKKVAFSYGFELEKEKTIETTYTVNRRSMMQNRYFAAFWTMRKKPSSSSEKKEAFGIVDADV